MRTQFIKIAAVLGFAVAIFLSCTEIPPMEFSGEEELTSSSGTETEISYSSSTDARVSSSSSALSSSSAVLSSSSATPRSSSSITASSVASSSSVARSSSAASSSSKTQSSSSAKASSSSSLGESIVCSNFYCDWPATGEDEGGCKEIRTDPYGLYGDSTSTCLKANTLCDYNGNGRYSNSTCSGTDLSIGNKPEKCGGYYCKWETGCSELVTDPAGLYSGSVGSITSCTRQIDDCKQYAPSQVSGGGLYVDAGCTQK